MTKYTLKFRYAHENLYLPLSSETLEEAIQEVKSFIEDTEKREYVDINGNRGKYKVIEAYIEKHIESKEIVWGLENED